MELDELKYQLKSKLASDHAGIADRDIGEILNKKAASVTDNLKRTLRFEIGCSILVLIGFGITSFVTHYRSFRIYFGVFSVVTVVFIVILFYLLRRTTQLSATILPVKSSLQSIVTILEEFMKRYFQFTMALVPICCVFAYILGYTEKARIPAVDHFSSSHFNTAWKVVAFLVVYMGALGVGVYYFTKWYLKKLYGNYISQLKDCIAELGERPE
jgi:hypothetical protein